MEKSDSSRIDWSFAMLPMLNWLLYPSIPPSDERMVVFLRADFLYNSDNFMIRSTNGARLRVANNGGRLT